MKNRKIVFTSATLSYLDRVLVLCESIRKFHPDWHIVLCLVDGLPDDQKISVPEGLIDEIFDFEDLIRQEPRRLAWIFEHDIVELCTAVKGLMLVRLLERDPSSVVYLDPDIALFSPLSEIAHAFRRSDVLLTPHQLEPDTTTQAIRDNEIGSLKYGIYNLGFLAVKNSKEGRRFASWWKDRLFEYCFDDVPNGLFTDQKWCDHAPVFFPTLAVIRHPGYNVASWNLSRRKIRIDLQGKIKCNEHELRFFHFTKVDGPGEAMLERYAQDDLSALELLQWYRRRLGHYSSLARKNYWKFGKFSDGKDITPHHRKFYRANPELPYRFADPFRSGDDSYQSYYHELNGRSSA